MGKSIAQKTLQCLCPCMNSIFSQLLLIYLPGLPAALLRIAANVASPRVKWSQDTTEYILSWEESPGSSQTSAPIQLHSPLWKSHHYLFGRPNFCTCFAPGLAVNLIKKPPQPNLHCHNNLLRSDIWLFSARGGTQHPARQILMHSALFYCCTAAFLAQIKDPTLIECLSYLWSKVLNHLFTMVVVFSPHLNLKTVPGNGVLNKNFETDGWGWFCVGR